MNFTLGDLPEIAQRCDDKGVKSYLTLNAIIYNHDLSLIKTIVQKVKEDIIEPKEKKLTAKQLKEQAETEAAEKATKKKTKTKK